MKPLTEVKKKMKLRLASETKKMDSIGSVGKKSRRQQSGYAFFFSQIAKSNSIQFSDLHPKVKQMWHDLSEEEQMKWKQSARHRYAQQGCVRV